MSTAALLTRPRPSGTDSGDDEVGHLYCCDPHLALCGVDLSDSDEVSEEDQDEVDLCELCEAIDDLEMPCPQPGCRYPHDAAPSC